MAVNETAVSRRKEIKRPSPIWVWPHWPTCKREEDKPLSKEMESHTRPGSESSWHRAWKCRLWNARPAPHQAHPRTTAWGLPLHRTCPHAGARGTMRAGPGSALRLAPPNPHTAWRPPHPHIPCLVNSPEAWGSGVAMVHSLTSPLQSFGLPRTVPSHDEFRSGVQSMSLIPAQMSGGRTSGNEGCSSVHTRSPQASRARFPSRGALSCLEDESLRTLHRDHSEPACSSKGSVRLGLTGQGQKDLTYTCTRTHHTHMHTYITCTCIVLTHLHQPYMLEHTHMETKEVQKSAGGGGVPHGSHTPASHRDCGRRHRGNKS